MCKDLRSQSLFQVFGMELSQEEGEQPGAGELGYSQEAQGWRSVRGLAGLVAEPVCQGCVVVHEHYEQEEAVDEDFYLMPSELAGVTEAQVTFPCLEEDLHAPAQAIELRGSCQGQPILGSIGQEDVPTEQMQVVLCVFYAIEGSADGKNLNLGVHGEIDRGQAQRPSAKQRRVELAPNRTPSFERVNS